jgi:glycosyltransferase involved in cell wall biosynthesis
LNTISSIRKNKLDLTTEKKCIQKPLVSIITVCYNSRETISKTIDSLIIQTSHNFEYIIIDGGSTDGTIELIRSYETLFNNNAIPFMWKSDKDEGIYDAMNKGIDLSCGTLIALLNSDDWYNPDTIENIIFAYQNHSDIGVFHGIVKFWKNNIFHSLHGASESFIESGSFPPHSTCFIKKSVYNIIGPYDLRYPIAADYDMLLRIKKNGVKFFLVEKVLANFSLHGISSSHPLSLDVIAIQKKHRFISKGRYWILSAVYRILNFLYPYLK